MQVLPERGHASAGTSPTEEILGPYEKLAKKHKVGITDKLGELFPVELKPNPALCGTTFVIIICSHATTKDVR